MVKKTINRIKRQPTEKILANYVSDKGFSQNKSNFYTQ
jgi:hypothetical protein